MDFTQLANLGAFLRGVTLRVARYGGLLVRHPHRLVFAILGAALLLGRPTAAEEPQGSGVLIVAGQRYSFTNTLCTELQTSDLSQFQLMSDTLVDGPGSFSVSVQISQTPDGTDHSIMVMTGGAMYLAHAKLEAGSWKNDLGEAEGPLIERSGKSLRASGTFLRATPPQEPVGAGSVEATCGRVMSSTIQ